MVRFGIAEDERVESDALACYVAESFPDARILWRVSDGQRAPAQMRRNPPDVASALIRQLWEQKYGGLYVQTVKYPPLHDI